MLRKLCLRSRAARRRCYSTVFEKWTGNTVEEIVDLSNGRLKLMTGHLARMCSGSVTATFEDSTVLATVVSRIDEDPSLRMIVDFLPSTSSLAQIPTNTLRAEFMQNDGDIVRSRMIDRSIRPLIHKQYPSTINIVCRPLVESEDTDLHMLGLNATSAALALSSVPLIANFGACRVAIIDGKITLNPPYGQLANSTMSMVLSGTRERKLVMIEMDGREIDLDTFMESVHEGLNEVHKIICGIERLQETAGKRKILTNVDVSRTQEVTTKVLEFCASKLEYILNDNSLDKLARDEGLNRLRKLIYKRHLQSSYSLSLFNAGFFHALAQLVRKVSREKGKRPDGRSIDEVRPIEAKIEVFPKLHGSSLFQRGQSQVLSTVTYDFYNPKKLPDEIAKCLRIDRKQNFTCYYEFPSFAVNGIDESTTKMQRRSVGHAILVDKVLRRVMPDNFTDYDVRLDCLVLESNGSTSMASITGGSMAMLDAGIPLISPAAGIAMGLYDEEENLKSQGPLILTDLMGLEDYVGDMDLKIAGTTNGFIGMQLDVSIPGLPVDLLRTCLEKGRTGLDHVLGITNKVISAPRSFLKPNAPLTELLKLNEIQQKAIFEPGSELIESISTKTGAKLIGSNGNIVIYARTTQELETARKMIESTSYQVISSDEDRVLIKEKFKWGVMFRDVKVLSAGKRGLTVQIPILQGPLIIAVQDVITQELIDTSKFQIGQTISLQYLRKDETMDLHRFAFLD
ncbi:Exoribonuclease and Polynucleotide phosphorylase domain containing protein [Aphelenchoides besseyi]|nr:Exoribonuclease and Polynucleotide phosphorylase domain containing protein [Aphelenchoides besseyi]